MWGCLCWRPKGHNIFTPLWRLDKLVTLPYWEDESLMNVPGGETSADQLPTQSNQVNSLISRAQNFPSPRSVRRISSDKVPWGGLSLLGAGLANWLSGGTAAPSGAIGQPGRSQRERQVNFGDIERTPRDPFSALSEGL